MRTVLTLGFIIFLLGCPGTVYQVSALPDSQPLRKPAVSNRPGPMVHAGSGLAFAETYGSFQRTMAIRYDTAGLDGSFNYNTSWDKCKVVASFYMYPTPQMDFVGAPTNVVASKTREWLKNEFDHVKGVFREIHPSMHSEMEHAVTTPAQGGYLNGHSFVFRIGSNISELRLFVYKAQWFIKYRFTYPEWCETEAFSRIEAMTGELPWAAPE